LEDHGVDCRMGSRWILGRLSGGCGLDSTGSGYGPVEGCRERGDEHYGSDATKFVLISNVQYACCMHCPSHSPSSDLPNVLWRVRIITWLVDTRFLPQMGPNRTWDNQKELLWPLWVHEANSGTKHIPNSRQFAHHHHSHAATVFSHRTTEDKCTLQRQHFFKLGPILFHENCLTLFISGTSPRHSALTLVHHIHEMSKTHQQSENWIRRTQAQLHYLSNKANLLNRRKAA
jgi:hypothetical protein